MINRFSLIVVGVLRVMVVGRVRKTRVGYGAVAAAAICGLLAGCGSTDGSGLDNPVPGPGVPVKPSASSAARILYLERLEAALPRVPQFPQGMQDMSSHAWDLSNPAICQSEHWEDALCADAVALGVSGAADMRRQKLMVRMIAFADEPTAASHFRAWSAATAKPEGSVDGLADYLPAPGGGWENRGVVVRQGAVIAKVEYGWLDTEVPGRLRDATKMVTERIRQAQSGKNPTASMR